jgi:predicted tellurium resistance membrane protein TerC
MMELLSNPQTWIAFATLTLLELVLGIDNIIFISILVDKLPKDRRETARRLGLFMAMFMRIGLLLVLAWIVGLVTPLFSVFGMEISGRDLILILGGLFLIWKSTTEIHQSMEGAEDHTTSVVKATFTSVILQIMVIDLVFSLDSMADQRAGQHQQHQHQPVVRRPGGARASRSGWTASPPAPAA